MMNLQKLWKKAINQIVEQEMLGWPPPCWGTYHQPERPIQNLGENLFQERQTNE